MLRFAQVHATLALAAANAGQADPQHCVCCTYDCGDRRGHVLDDRQYVTPERCVCGDYWPCERSS